MNKNVIKLSIACLLASVSVLMTNCNVPETKQNNSENSAQKMMSASPEERGKYLVMIGGCNDCHSPKLFTDQGPIPDSTRFLSGHPADSKLPDINWSETAPGRWGAIATGDLTAWVGMWGVSFAANLTPDTATGTGAWTPDLFMKILRSGKHMGMEAGRPILPPMPWQDFAGMRDEDLNAIFAYLHSIKPISNKVPDPLPPQSLPKK